MEICQEIPATVKASLSKEKVLAPEGAANGCMIDMEINEMGTVLRQEVSGPPYSVFSSPMKIWIIFLVSVSALISPFGATTYYPALNVLTDVLHITPTMTNISITTYMVGTVLNNRTTCS